MTSETGWIFCICAIFFVLAFAPGQSKGQDGCPSAGSTTPLPEVEVILNNTRSLTPGDATPTLSLFVANCSANYPIHWTFLHHPHILQEEESSSSMDNGTLGGFGWNVSHFRLKDDILDESGPQSWVAILTFANISVDTLKNGIQPRCTSVGDPCLGRAIPGLEGQSQDNQNSAQGRKNCSVDLWFDEASGHFICKDGPTPIGGGMSSNSTPTMNFRYCANPTECGVSSRDECWNHGGHHHPKGCVPAKNGSCNSLVVGSEFPIPKVITCTPKRKGGGVGVMLGYFHSLKEVEGGRPASSYVSWEEADPGDLVSITPTKSHLMANESFELECSASSYYFAGGLHLTIKSVSGSNFYSETELGQGQGHSLNDTVESLQLWTPRSSRPGLSTAGDKHMREMPLRRTILARNLLLPPGDYELSCYAPVWNSTQWTTKTVLVSVSRTSVPTFITGNGTLSMQFAPWHNISCLARGVPPPKLSWNYRSDRVQVLEVGGESKQMSWSILTLPANMETSTTELEFKCRAENAAGFAEKLFLVTRNDESFLVSTKIAATVVLLGFVANLIVFFFCWKKLFAESDEEEDEEKKELAGIKILRQLWNGQVSWCRCGRSKRGCGGRSRSGVAVAGSEINCTHPKCRQKQTQTV